jgi:acylphosphatase
MKAVKLTISGKVQGVGYRRWFAQYAVALGLKGYVQNLVQVQLKRCFWG